MSEERAEVVHGGALLVVTPGGPRLLGLHLHSRTLGTVIGDFCSHNVGLDDAGASMLLSLIVAVFFLTGRCGGFFCCRFIG
jgi:Repeat of Unknown Function (DUF347)